MGKHSNIFVDQLFPDQQLTVSYSKKGFVEFYHRVKHYRQDLFMLINEHITEQDIDDYVNSEIDDTIFLASNCYWKELIEFLYSKNDSINTLEFYQRKLYNKPITLITIGIQENIDSDLNNLDTLLKEDALSYPLNEIVDNDINFDELFTNEYDNCLLYYINFCQNQGCDTNVDLHKELYDSVNYKKIDDLLGHESEEVRNILKLCYEDRA